MYIKQLKDKVWCVIKVSYHFVYIFLYTSTKQIILVLIYLHNYIISF